MMTQVSTGPPTVTTHPTSQLTTVSMSVTLNCEGTGRGSITYQWQSRNGQWSSISNNSNINNRQLVVRNLQESQQYRCVVSNEAGGTMSNEATITVLSKFDFYDYLLINLLYLRNHFSASRQTSSSSFISQFNMYIISII